MSRNLYPKEEDIRGNREDLKNLPKHIIPDYRNLNFPQVEASNNHYVLYDPKTVCTSKPPEPAEVSSDDRSLWDNTREFVRMPYSIHSYLNDKPRWLEIIKALKNPGRNSRELVETILSYNPTYRNKWKFTSLCTLLDEITQHERDIFFGKTLNRIAKLAMKLQELVTVPVPLLRQQTNDCLSLSQEQIASLLANAFFCTFPYRNADNGPYKNYPGINFARLYGATGPDVLQKLNCIIHYFTTITRNEDAMPKGVLTFCRRSVENLPRWDRSRAYISDTLLLADAKGLIEGRKGLIHMDFANKFLGGGVLGHGSVQEEILFVTCPELIITKLFTEVLQDNEALLMIGAQRFSNHVGYSRTFEFVSGHVWDVPRDDSGRYRSAVLAIDALLLRHKWQEAKKENIDREINKAWVGFSFFTPHGGSGLNYPGVVTGNWGCGAFGGTPQLKSLLQLCAAAHARRPLLYVTFEDVKLMNDLNDMYRFLVLNDVTVPQLYGHILDFARRDKVDFNELFDYLKSVITRSSRGNYNSTPTHKAKTKDTEHLTMDLKPSTGKSPYLTRSQRNSHHRQHEELNSQDIIEAELNSEDFNSEDLKQIDLNFEDLKEAEQIKNHSLKAREPNSPDLFTPEEMSVDQSQKQDNNKMDTSESIETELNQQSLQRKRTKRVSDSDDEMAGNMKKMATTENKMASQTSRLIDKLEKFDETNGKLNLSFSHKKYLDNGESKKTDTNSHQEMPPEVKKRIVKKITDYFSSTDKKS